MYILSCAGSDQTSVVSTLELQGHFLRRLSLHVPLTMDLPSSIELPDKFTLRRHASPLPEGCMRVAN
jgi:hypothetical protein